jgi:hypothetical protein
MTAKTSISLIEAQEAFARERESNNAERAALHALLEERRRGPFVGMAESKKRMQRMIAARKKHR